MKDDNTDLLLLIGGIVGVLGASTIMYTGGLG